MTGIAIVSGVSGMVSRDNHLIWSVGRLMPQPPLDPPVADTAPDADVLTRYDEEHLVTYLRILDADAEGADWAEVARLVLHIDPSREKSRAHRAWQSHLARAKWLTEHGYRHLLRGGSAVD
jgi:hypothetical protein